MHKLEVHVVYLPPNNLCGPGLTHGSLKTEVVHIYDLYFSSGMNVPVGGCPKQLAMVLVLFFVADYDLDSSGADRPSVEP